MKKALLILILCLFTAFTLISCNGGENEQPAVTYTVSWMDENGSKLSSTTVNEGEVPSYTYTVTDTAEWDYTFEGCTNLTSVTIPDSVTTIGNHAFYGCTSIQSVSLGAGLDTIGNFAFANFDYVAKTPEELEFDDAGATKQWYIGENTIINQIINHFSSVRNSRL